MTTESVEDAPAVDTSNTPRISVQDANGQNVSIQFTTTDTVLEIKEKLHALNGIPIEAQELVFNGQLLEDEQVLNEYGIEQENILTLRK